MTTNNNNNNQRKAVLSSSSSVATTTDCDLTRTPLLLLLLSLTFTSLPQDCSAQASKHYPTRHASRRLSPAYGVLQRSGSHRLIQSSVKNELQARRNFTY